MSETKTRLARADALAIAESVSAALRPACERIEIAGSLRRGKASVGDIEIVAISKQTAITDLFGETIGATLDVDAVIAAEGWPLIKNGDKYKQFAAGDVTCDLFLPTRETWGVVFTIRTGDADFARWLVTQRFAGGAMPSDLRCRDGRLWRGGVALDTPEEADVFRAIGLKWIPPEQRTMGKRVARPL